jgi:hypothetical protein
MVSNEVLADLRLHDRIRFFTTRSRQKSKRGVQGFDVFRFAGAHEPTVDIGNPEFVARL